MNDRSDGTEGTVLVNAVTDWLMQQALGQADIEDIFDGCCQRLDAAGLPIARAMIFFRTLHPLCLLYTSPSPRDRTRSRMPSSA